MPIYEQHRVRQLLHPMKEWNPRSTSKLIMQMEESTRLYIKYKTLIVFCMYSLHKFDWKEFDNFKKSSEDISSIPLSTHHIDALKNNY